MRLHILAAAMAALLVGSSAPPVPATTHASIAHRPRQVVDVRQTGWASSNWSGYAITGAFTSVTGQWVVPSVSRTRNATYSSAWAGIDGFNNSNLIQTGTESDFFGGSAHYDAWWEILPNPSNVITTMAIHPGDHMSASVSQDADRIHWTISIADTTSGQSFSIDLPYSGPGASAEWIEEAPSVNGQIATLAQYSSPDIFDPGTANGANPQLTAADGGVMIQKKRQVSTPSVPDADTDGFSMTYGSSTPAPPSS